MPTTTATLPPDTAARLRALAAPTAGPDGAPARPRRTPVLGLAGAPGAGKSTVAAALRDLAEREGLRAVVVPMDGYHLANPVLDALGRRGRKGAPDTFDVAGYVHLLRRLREPGRGTVYAPAFDRAADAGLASAIAVSADVDLVITEGNYLLHDGGGWEAVAPHLDEVWWIACDDAERHGRLVRRHVDGGRSEGEATAFVDSSDEVNARLVGPAAARAAHVITTSTRG